MIFLFFIFLVNSPCLLFVLYFFYHITNKNVKIEKVESIIIDQGNKHQRWSNLYIFNVANFCITTFIGCFKKDRLIILCMEIVSGYLRCVVFVPTDVIFDNVKYMQTLEISWSQLVVGRFSITKLVERARYAIIIKFNPLKWSPSYNQ